MTISKLVAHRMCRCTHTGDYCYKWTQ